MKYIELQEAFELEINQLDNNITKPTTSDIEYWLMAGLDKFIKTCLDRIIVYEDKIEISTIFDMLAKAICELLGISILDVIQEDISNNEGLRLL